MASTLYHFGDKNPHTNKRNKKVEEISTTALNIPNANQHYRIILHKWKNITLRHMTK